MPPVGPAAPVLSVVRGDPSAEELAALISALLAVRTAEAAAIRAAAARRPVRSVWSSKSRLVRAPLRPGPGAWRTSALPR